ncbi:MAG TPA: serine hydrolase [Acidimicrobiales bacterium]|nr:serine hydrolase [Acidimicrobiales bacterium]
MGVALASAAPGRAYAQTAQRRPAAPTTVPAAPPPKAWILVDADTGNVLDAGNDRTALPPASLTKVVTALAVVESLPPGTDTVPVSARAAAMPASRIGMKQGEVWTLTDTLYSLMLSSANDAAVALAERAGGTVEGFQPIFAATAAGLGMADHPVLNDPAGLDGPDGVEGGNLVSARDLAIAARALLAEPELAAIVATPLYHFTGPDGVGHRLSSHNRTFLTAYPGAIGMKTGYTSRAGACLIAGARRDGRTMIAVVLHDAYPNRTASALLDKGFATPATGEPGTDPLPPVRLGNPTAAGEAAPAAQPAPAAAGAVVPPARQAATARRAAAASSSGSAWSSAWASVPARLGVAAVALVALVQLGAAVWRPRQRRRSHAPAHGRSRRAA